MTILHLTPDLDTAGAAIALERLIAARGAAETHVVVSMTDVGAVGRRLAAAGVPVIAARMAHGRPTPAGLLRLARLIRAHRPDVVHAWMYHAALAATLVRPFAGRPKLLWSIRRSLVSWGEFSRLTALTIRICARMSGRADAIVANSETGRATHAAAGYAGGIRVIPNGIDVEALRPDPAGRAALRAEAGIPGGAFVVGLVGRYAAVKRHDLFVAAAARLAAVCPAAVFVMAGPGVSWDQAALAGAIDRAGIRDRVRLLGERSDLQSLYSSLDVLTLCSSAEGFPNVVVEAMACGVPAVVTAAGDAPSIVDDTGLVADGNPQAIADALRRLFDEGAAARDDRGQRARRRVAGHYSLASVADAYGMLYRELS